MKVHIIGRSGSGKTTLAEWLEGGLGIRKFELDAIVYEQQGADRRSPEEIARRVESVLNANGWVTEGHYRGEWVKPLLEEAHVIVWLDMPLLVCAVRVLKRHLGELWSARDYSRVIRFVRFLHYTFGRASTQNTETTTLLSVYEAKVYRCRSLREVDALKQRLMDTY